MRSKPCVWGEMEKGGMDWGREGKEEKTATATTGSREGLVTV